jgi:hypothetical protein
LDLLKEFARILRTGLRLFMSNRDTFREDHSVLHRRSGEIAVLTTEEAKDATETVKVLRDFLGL